jgi:hypothetical protein
MKCLINRPLPGVGSMPQADMEAVVANSEAVLTQMRGEGKKIRQIRSFATPDAVFCVYEAESEEQIRDHAKRADLPAETVIPIGAEVQHDTSEN